MSVAFRCFAVFFVFTILAAEGRAEVDRIVRSLEVRYVGPRTVAPQRILAQFSSKVGEPVAPQRIDEDIRRLFASGLVTNAKMLLEDVPGGVALIAVVECRPRFGGVSFRGNTIYPDKRLGRALNLEADELIDEGELRRSRAQIAEMYRKKGYGEAEISYRIGRPDSAGRARVEFLIEENSGSFLHRVWFSGNHSISDDELKETMSQKEPGIRNLLRPRGQTDADSITRDVQAIEKLYRDRGFLRAKVVSVRKVAVDSQSKDLIFGIDEGTRHRVASLELSGVNALSVEKDLLPHLKTASGKPFSEGDLQDDIERILNVYRSKGYLDVRVTPIIEHPESTVR